MYANALAQMLSDKNITGGSSSSHGDVITLPQNRGGITTTMAAQQPPISSDIVELKQSSDNASQLKNLLMQATPSQQSRLQSADLLTAALHSHSPNHGLTISTTAASTSPKPHTAFSQDLHPTNNPVPSMQNSDLQATNSPAGLNASKAAAGEDSKQRFSPHPAATMIGSDHQLSPNSAALGGMANIHNQRSPNRQQTVDVKDETSLATATLPGKPDDLVLTEDTTKMLLKQLAQQQLPQQSQKSIPGSIVIPGTSSADTQEELTIHPGGSGELLMMSYYITCV